MPVMCAKLLESFPTDRGATLGLYPAIKRSVVRALSVLRYPSPNCDQAKARRSAQAADFVQTHCSRYADHWVGRPRAMFAKSTEARRQEPRPPYRLFADPTRDRCGNVWYCGERTRERTWRYRRERPHSRQLGTLRGVQALLSHAIVGALTSCACACPVAEEEKCARPSK
jgi:hypothetical protein